MLGRAERRRERLNAALTCSGVGSVGSSVARLAGSTVVVRELAAGDGVGVVVAPSDGSVLGESDGDGLGEGDGDSLGVGVGVVPASVTGWQVVMAACTSAS